MKQLIQINLLLLLLAGVSGCSTFGYYSQAIGGHLSLMMRGEPVERLQNQPDTPPELRQKLELAEAARRFARNRLDLPVGDAFTGFVELDRPWVVVNLVAVPEFSLEPHRWCYPVLGCQAYRGYFKLEQARKEEARFRQQGYDTFIGGVTAYSTLGWFDDPLHTGFTRLSDDRMVALMFHELAHQVVYMAEDTAFNESFATAVELEGLRLWLEQQNSAEDFDLALLRQEHRNQTLALVEATTAELEQLYNRQDKLTPEQLREHKAGHLEQLAQAYARLADDYREPGPFGAPPAQLNNANLALFRQYNQHVPAFRQLLRELDYNFGEFYRQVEQLSGQPEPKRRARLAELSHRFDEHL
ncbi:aminopeptidase [Marinobacter vinifirmus]|uniref:Zinc protease n=1 Tax=Marinobacter vinifirmus TaxID=355591 RepID=A0A558BBC8_9GAMM|nr:aminopeptidase [Marinobacter vinifirmus]TVT33812.1 MAG: zinc protease [Marinobacter vinifirmus]